MKDCKISNLKKLLCASLIGIMIISGPASVSASTFDWIQIIWTLKRTPDYKNSYGRCWVDFWWCGPKACTESYYSYGSSAEVIYYYYNSNGKYCTKKASGASYGLDYAMTEIVEGGKAYKAYFSCNAYRFSYKKTMLYTDV